MPQPATEVEIKHGIDQFLSDPLTSAPGRRPFTVKRRNLRLQKRAAYILSSAYKRLHTLQRTSAVFRKHMVRAHLEVLDLVEFNL